MGLRCCSNGVSSMLEGFNIIMGVIGLELELLTCVSGFGSLQILTRLSLNDRLGRVNQS